MYIRSPVIYINLWHDFSRTDTAARILFIYINNTRCTAMARIHSRALIQYKEETG